VRRYDSGRSPLPKHRCEQARLLVASGGGAFGLRPAIVLQFEQGELPGLSGPPGLNVPAAQFEKTLPTKWTTIDHDHVRLAHGVSSKPDHHPNGTNLPWQVSPMTDLCCFGPSQNFETEVNERPHLNSPVLARGIASIERE
jgi:hypothetical protein